MASTSELIARIEKQRGRRVEQSEPTATPPEQPEPSPEPSPELKIYQPEEEKTGTELSTADLINRVRMGRAEYPEHGIAAGQERKPLSFTDVVSGMIPEGEPAETVPEGALDVLLGAGRGMEKATPGLKQYGQAMGKLGDIQMGALRKLLELSGMDPSQLPESRFQEELPEPTTRAGKVAEPVAEFGTRLGQAAALSSLIPSQWKAMARLPAKAAAGEVPFIHKGVQEVQEGRPPGEAIAEGIIGLGLGGAAEGIDAVRKAMKAAKLSRGLSLRAVGHAMDPQYKKEQFKALGKAFDAISPGHPKIETIEDLYRSIQGARLRRFSKILQLNEEPINIGSEIIPKLKKSMDVHRTVPFGESDRFTKIYADFINEFGTRSYQGTMDVADAVAMKEDIATKLSDAFRKQDITEIAAYGQISQALEDTIDPKLSDEVRSIIKTYEPITTLEMAASILPKSELLQRTGPIPSVVRGAKKYWPIAAAAGGGPLLYYGGKSALEAIAGE